MTPKISGPALTHRHEYGFLKTAMGGLTTVVGDRLVPSVIEAHFPGADGQPALFMCIEVIAGVPRCTELSFTTVEGGREIRPLDLKAMLDIGIDDWVENLVALCSPVIEDQSASGVTRARQGQGEKFVAGGMKAVRDARRGSRRRMTDERKQRVAGVYNAQEMGGLEAVEAAFAVSRSTAARYIKAAREAGLIAKQKEMEQ